MKRPANEANSLLLPRTSTALTFLMVLVVLSQSFNTALAEKSKFTETFSSDLMKDAVNTTGNWDTSAEQLGLFPFERSIVGSYDTPATSYGLAVVGSHAYIADASSGLQVIDISDPANPILAGSYDTPGTATDVAVSGNYAYVADRFSGFKVIDISDPTNPTLAGSSYTPNVALSVTLTGNYAFVGTFNNSVTIIDISDPTNPIYVATYITPHATRDIAISGNYAYVADGDSGLQVLDISTPTTPVLTGSYNTPAYAYGIAVSGSYAFVADGLSGLKIINISDPTNPILAASYDTPGAAFNVIVSGDRAYVADSDKGLQVVDISDPNNPTLVENIDTPGTAWAVAFDGENAYVADGSGGLQIIQIGSLSSGIYTGSYDTPGDAVDVAVSGNYTFIADGNLGLQVIDTSDPAAPTLASTFVTPGYTYGVDISGNHAFVADYDFGLQVIDISDPNNPTQAGSVITPGTAFDVTIAGNYAYVAAYDLGLQIIDISDPTNPSYVGGFDTPGFTWDVAIAGGHAFVTDYGSGLQVIDISDPTTPTLTGNYDTPGGAYCVAVAGAYAYVADNTFGLQVIDISDPANPTLAGTYDTPGNAIGIAVSGSRAFVADRIAGLQIIDISDPTNPILASNYDTPHFSRDVVIAGDYAFIADYASGLQIIQLQQSEFDIYRNIGQSLTLNPDGEIVVKARLRSTQTSDVSWELSSNGGMGFKDVIPGGGWKTLDRTGTELIWRSTHELDDSGVNPTVSEVTVEWRTRAGRFASITDGLNDQGGWVQAKFNRSGYDFPDEIEFPILGYQIYRRVDDLVLAARIAEEGPKQPELGTKELALASFEPEVIKTLDDRTFIISRAKAVSEFPSGAWELLYFQAAAAQDSYTVAVPTLPDSNGQSGDTWSVYFVSTHTTDPAIWFASEPDSGFSADNIAPEAPTSLMVAHEAVLVGLDWDDAPELDFDHYRIYRDTSPGFVPSVGNLVHQLTASTWTDPSANNYSYHYLITAVDKSGNESEVNATSTVSDVPTADYASRYALNDASPNPFNPATKLSFELPRKARVNLSVYDLAGRLVATLVNGMREPGQHSVVWDGRNSGGGAVASGIYLYRIDAGEFQETKRMTLVK